MAQDTAVDLEEIRFTVESYRINGDNPLGAQAFEVLQPYLGDQFGLEGLSAAADALERELINAGYSFHRVVLPPQQLFSGTVSFNIVRFAVGNVVVETGDYFDELNIRNSLPQLQTGQTPNTLELSQSLELANQHSSKNLQVKFSEGEEPDTIDSSLFVRDIDPSMAFVTLDNTGNDNNNGKLWRSTLGYQNSNLFNLDHSLTATFSMAPEDFDSAQQFGLNYLIPMYRHGGSLSFLLTDSEVNSGNAANVQISGKGNIFGVTYSRPMIAKDSYKHSWSVSFSHKSFDNDITIVGIPAGNKILSQPIEAAYLFNNRHGRSFYSGSVKLATNFETGGDNSNSTYSNARANAKANWFALRYQLGYDWYFREGWRWNFSFSGQETSDLLISGEQFGLGGANSLRGFEERGVTGDKGYALTTELWLPVIESYNVTPMLFYGMGQTSLNDGPSYDPSSVGMGLRWAWKQSLNLSLDYGKISEGGGADPAINKDGDDKFHLSLVYRF